MGEPEDEIEDCGQYPPRSTQNHPYDECKSIFMTLGWKCFKQQESPIESYTSWGGFTPAWIPPSTRKSSWSISVPHVVCRDERSIDTTGCSQGLGRCLLQKPAAMDSQHDPSTVYGIFLRIGLSVKVLQDRVRELLIMGQTTNLP